MGMVALRNVISGQSSRWFGWVAALALVVSCSDQGALAQEAEADPQPDYVGDMVVVVGAGGTEEYEQLFSQWADLWKAAAKASHLEYHEIGREDNPVADREQFGSLLDELKAVKESPLWIVLIGHGTFDRKLAKFNLRGRDFTARELKQWLIDCDRSLVLVNSFSTSGAFLGELRGNDRVVITATKSGMELNYSRFGGFLAESLADPTADLDHDDQVSLLEAYLLASSKVARFYEEASRLATEHALLEDNNDGKGTPADFFVGIRAESKAKDGAKPDGRLAHRYILVPSSNGLLLTSAQERERDRLEAEIDRLRDSKSTMSEDEYFTKLEVVMVELAQLYQEPDAT